MTSRLPTALTLGAAVVAALVGCASTADPRPSTTTSTTSVTASTPAPTITGPARVAPASSATDAIRAADATVRGYYAASFNSGHAGGQRLDLVTPWATGTALENERSLASYLQRARLRLDGEPTPWTLNASRSSAARTDATEGAPDLLYGAVRMVGCIESTNRPVGDGAPAWTTKGSHTSIDWTVLYSPTQQHWLVTSSTSPSTVLDPSSCG